MKLNAVSNNVSSSCLSYAVNSMARLEILFGVGSLISGRMFILLLAKFFLCSARVVLFADVVSIPILSFFLKFQFRRWQNQGLIIGYCIDLHRITRFYYELNLRLVLGSGQAETFLKDLFIEILHAVQY